MNMTLATLLQRSNPALRNTATRAIPGMVLALALLWLAPAQAQSLPFPETLTERYADLMTNTAKATWEKPLKVLLQEAVTYRDAHATDAEAWITTARIRIGYASMQDGKGQLGMLKDVKSELEKAIALDPAAQEGRAQALLGNLYATLPGSPLSFGDKKQGEALLKQAIAINANNAANGYYYAQYLLANKQQKEAKEYLLKAMTAINADTTHPKWQLFQKENIEESLKIIAK